VIGIDNGFAHYSAKIPKTYSKDFKAFITRVELPYIDSVIHLKKILNTETEFKFPFSKNSFRFYYTSPFFENNEQLSFSYFLENYSEKWSDFSSVIYKDFINLHEGKYVFRVKAKNIYEVESNTATFSFTILSPWYSSIMAYFAYLLIIFILFYVSFRYIRFRARHSKERAVKRHQLESKKREEEYQHQAILNEKEIIRLKNEKLLTEMDYRGKELANQTMIIVQKNKFLSKFKDELNLIQKTTDDPQLRTKMIVLARRLDKEIDDHGQTKVFKTYFEEVHNDFISRLKEKHSGLTPREIHLSAYIRMNLSSKEIASLLNITYRGVEISRYRLRKKLELSREVSLSSYLLNI